MPPRRKQKPSKLEEDSLSEEVEDDSDLFIRPKRPKIRPNDDKDWIDKYGPQKSADVCVNPRKLKELREVLVKMVDGLLKCRLLVVSGPSGSAKLTLVKCLGNELISSQKQSTTQFGHGIKKGDSENIVEYFDSALENVYQRSHFTEFIDGCRYRVGSNLALILIEELPNIFHQETLANFRLTLSNWIYSQGELPPLVLCLTEVEMESENSQKGYYNIENSLTVETLLGRDLLVHGMLAGLIERVKFLPVAKTFMKKTLTKIIKSEQVKLPEKLLASLLAALYESGDIRALICTLEFIARSKSGQVDIEGMIRESQISLFHAVGKVIHSSTKYQSLDDELSDYYSTMAVVDSYNNLGLLHLALLENYQIYNGLQYEIEIAANLVDTLSISDTMSSLEEGHEYGIRGVRLQLRTISEKQGRTQPMKFPRHFKMLKASNKVKREVDSYVRYLGNLWVSFSNVNLVDGCLVPKIYNSFRYKLKHGSTPYSYNRVGGKFQELHADDQVTVMEHEQEQELGIKDQFYLDIQAKMEQDALSDEEAELSEAIDDTDTDEDFNDSLDSRLISLTQKNEADDFSDDPELDWLVSQGKL